MNKGQSGAHKQVKAKTAIAGAGTDTIGGYWDF
jgi:hypothetical protein